VRSFSFNHRVIILQNHLKIIIAKSQRDAMLVESNIHYKISSSGAKY
jgi:hypothetical protein